MRPNGPLARWRLAVAFAVVSFATMVAPATASALQLVPAPVAGTASAANWHSSPSAGAEPNRFDVTIGTTKFVGELQTSTPFLGTSYLGAVKLGLWCWSATNCLGGLYEPVSIVGTDVLGMPLTGSCYGTREDPMLFTVNRTNLDQPLVTYSMQSLTCQVHYRGKFDTFTFSYEMVASPGSRLLNPTKTDGVYCQGSGNGTVPNTCTLVS